MYDRHATLVTTDPDSVSIYAVKKQSALNSLTHFHVVDGLPSDIMHDMLEGILPRHIKVMLRKFIMGDMYFTLDQLNRNLSTFPFCTCHSRNKPSLIKNVNQGDHHMRKSGIYFYNIH